MKREIKFRGLGYDNKWHYGYYYCIGDIHYIQTPIESISVNPFTVSEYTGLKDKNGKEIYEGDIIKAGNYTMYGGIFFVEWDNEINSFVFRQELVSPTFLFKAKEIEVIGNIYENPKLLKTT